MDGSELRRRRKRKPKLDLRNGDDPVAELLNPSHVEELRKGSGLNNDTLFTAGIHTEKDLGVVNRKLHRRHALKDLGSCIAFPFFDVSTGRQNCYCRFKPDHPRTKDGKPVKYESPVGESNKVYIPPDAFASLRDPTKPLVVTEGEKKSLKATQEGHPTIGLVGVWGWQVKRPEKDGRKVGPRKLIPDLELIPWKGRTVRVCFDSDIRTNGKVKQAARELARVLTNKGAKVTIIHLPHGPRGEDGKPGKVGLDDFLVAKGRKALEKLVTGEVSPDTDWHDEAWDDDDGALISTRACDLKPKPVVWLWPGYIPRGAVTILDGDPGLGKSQITLDLAARVSRGWPMPPFADRERVTEPAGVVILSAEDDAECTIRPRLEAAGANLKLIEIVDGVKCGDSDRPVILPDDLDLVRAKGAKINARLIVVDPLMAFLTGSVDSHKDADVRRVLHHLRRFSESAGAAVVTVRHLNKQIACTAAVYRGGGSIGIIGASRAAFVVGRHPDRADLWAFAPVKCNLGPMPRSLTYTFEEVQAASGIKVSRIAWEGETDLIADQLLRHGKPGRPPVGLPRAVAFLRKQLAEGPVSAKAIDALAAEEGISERTLKRARRDLNVMSKPSGKRYMLSLPEEV
jgi:hypothetical protein